MAKQLSSRELPDCDVDHPRRCWSDRAWPALQLAAWATVAVSCWALPETYTSGFAIAEADGQRQPVAATDRVLEIAASLVDVPRAQFPTPHWRRDERAGTPVLRVHLTHHSPTQARHMARALFEATWLEGDRVRREQLAERTQQERWLVEDLGQRLDAARRQHRPDEAAPGNGAPAFQAAAATLTTLRARREQVEVERKVTATRIAALRQRLNAGGPPAPSAAHTAAAQRVRLRPAVLHAGDQAPDLLPISAGSRREIEVPERLTDALPLGTLQRLSHATNSDEHITLLGKLLSRREQWEALKQEAAFLEERIEQEQARLSQVVLSWTLDSLDAPDPDSSQGASPPRFRDVELPLRVKTRGRDLVLGAGLLLSALGWCASRTPLGRCLTLARGRARHPSPRRRRRRAARFALI